MDVQKEKDILLSLQPATRNIEADLLARFVACFEQENEPGIWPACALVSGPGWAAQRICPPKRTGGLALGCWHGRQGQHRGCYTSAADRLKPQEGHRLGLPPDPSLEMPASLTNRMGGHAPGQCERSGWGGH